MQEIKVKNIIIGKQYEASENYKKFVNAKKILILHKNYHFYYIKTIVIISEMC